MEINDLFDELKEPSLMRMSLFAGWSSALAENAVKDTVSISFIKTLEFCYRALHHCLMVMLLISP